MNDTTANTAPALQAVKQPLWMACATMDELNAYIKRAKVSTAKGDDLRAKWQATQAVAADDDRNTDPRTVKYEESEVLGDSQQRAIQADMGNVAISVNDPALSEQPAAKANAASWDAVAKGNSAQAAVDEIIKRVSKPAAKKAAKPTGLVTQYIDPTLIDVKDGWNARIDFGDLQELAGQIKSQKVLDGHGLLNDIRVQLKDDNSGRYWLVDGERRYQSVMGLIDQGEFFEFGIPAKVEAADANLDDLIIKMFLANEGKRLLPYEEGMYFKRLQDGGMTIKEIEAKTGRSDSSIWYGLALIVADEDLVDAIRKGTIGTTIAKTIAVNARGDKAKQKELVAKAKEVKTTGDKKKLAALKKEIDEARRVKAAKERPNLKIKARKAEESEIADMGAKVAARLKEVMDKFGMEHDTNMEEWIGNDRELQIAANFGALQALKAIMGVKVKVSF